MTEPENYETTDIVDVQVPERRVSDAPRAQMVCESAYLAYAKYHYSVFNMMEQFDGLLPHDPAYLEESGLSWISNVPYRKGWSQIEQAATTRLNMLKAAIYFSQLCFRPFEKEDEEKPQYFFLTNPVVRQNLESRLTKIFIDMLDRDPCFFAEFLLKISYGQVAWGLGISEVDDHSVFPGVPEMLNVYFERANKKENIKFYIRVFFQRADDLYELYRKEEARGWDKSYYIKEGLEEALQWALERVVDQTYQSWELITRTYDVQQLTQYYGQCQDQITWAWIWNEEIEGGVTKTLYRWNRGLINHGDHADLIRIRNIWGDSTMPNGQYLSYQFHDKNLKLEEVWRIYPNTGMTNTNIAQDLRGLGGYAYELDISNNIKRNAINDAMVTRLPLWLQAQFGQQTDQINQINIIAGIGVLPPSMAPQREIGSDGVLRAAIETLQFDMMEYSRDTSQYNPQVAGKLTDRATSNQVQAISGEVQRQRSDFASVPLDSLRGELLAILHRLKKSYDEDDAGFDPQHYFEERVRNDLWPLTGQEQLEEKEQEFTFREFFNALIDAVDYVKLDYTSNDIVNLQQLLQLAQTPEGKMRYMRKLAMAYGASYSEVELIWPYPDSADLNVNDSALALIENFMFWDTGEVAYNALQNPATHLEIHFSKASQVLAALKEGRDPMTVWNWLANMIPHAQKHLEQLSQDPYQVDLFEQMQATFKQLIQIADGVGKFAQQQAAQIAQQQAEGQQQQGPQIPPEVAAKIQILQIQTQEKKQRSDQLYALKTQQNQEKFQQQMQMKQESHEQQMMLNAQNAALQLEIAKQNQGAN
jgi:hypothetical protein